MNNETDVSIKFKNSVTGEKKLEKYAQTLSQIKSVLGSIDRGAAQQLEDSAKNTTTVNKDMDKMSKNFNLAFNYTALRTFARGLSKVVQGFSAMTSKSTAFLEDFNLFQVAFRGNYTEATKFVNKLSEMYGLDEDWLIKTTSQFKQLSNAMGLANETGEKVSKLMTELAIDISSLYNIDVDRASSVLQSALAGQTKPVRALGADITQASLQQTLSRLDISQQVAQLSYAEKRLLIMISLTQQLSSVTNDWGRTLESPSNQIRIMNEQWQRLQRNVGNIFLQIVGKVLPYLNAVLMVLNEIAKIIASLFGYKLDDFDFFDESTVNIVDEFGDGLESAADSAKKLKQGLRGFDKLNVVSTPSTGTSGVSGGGVGGINPKLMDAFNKAFDEYQKKLTDVEMKATKIRDRIMEWLGFTKVVDDETGEVSFKFDHITGGTVLGALMVGGSIYTGISKIFKFLNRIGLLKFTGIKDIAKIFSGGKFVTGISKVSGAFEGLASALGISAGWLAAIVAAITAIVAALVHAYSTNDKFRKKVNEMAESVLKLYATIYNKIIKPVVEALSKELVPAFETAWEMIKEILDVADIGLIAFFSALADTISGVAKIITDIINLDFRAAFGDLKDLVKNVYETWVEYWQKIGEKFEKWKDKLKEKLDEWIEKIKTKIDELPQKLEELPEKAGEAIGRMIAKIQEKIEQTNWEEMGEKIVRFIRDGIIREIPRLVAEFNTLPFRILIKIGELSGDLWTVGYNIMTAIGRGMAGFITGGGLAGIISDFVRGIKKGLKIQSPSRVILDAKIGDFSMEAIILGMERQLPLVKEQAEAIVNTLNNGIKEATIESNFNYDIPDFNTNSFGFNSQSYQDVKDNKQPINPTIIVQVGDKQLAKQVITDLQDMATNNGKPIVIGG